MANRRMFSLDVVDTDIFLEMPVSTQALYFHLGMRADDDGFVSSPKRISVLVGCGVDDLKLLISKGFIIPFESGVCVIREWRVNNFIRNDRYHKTCHAEEYHSLMMLENGKYTLKNGLNTEIDNVGIPNDNLMSYQRYPEVRLGKVSKVHSCKSASANCARAQLFLQFWKAYPKKKGKANCEKWFTSHKPDEELVKTMIAALDTQRLTEDWTKENGRYIPLPYTWLNGKRWEDEITVPSMPKTTHEQFKEVSL